MTTIVSRTNASNRHAERAADAAADRADQAILDVWDDILHFLPGKRLTFPISAAHEMGRAIAGLYKAMIPEAADSIERSLRAIALWSYQEARDAIRASVDQRRILATRNIYVREDEYDPFHDFRFPIPDKATIEEIIYQPFGGLTWKQRLERATYYATPGKIARVVSQGFQSGDSPTALAKRLKPYVNGIRSTARRLARTMSMHVNHGMQMRAWDGLGELLIGYQVHATHDKKTRPKHRARDGFKYFKEPRWNQRGLDQMPRPPLEADGTIAWNCRCHLTPILADE